MLQRLRVDKVVGRVVLGGELSMQMRAHSGRVLRASTHTHSCSIYSSIIGLRWHLDHHAASVEAPDLFGPIEVTVWQSIALQLVVVVVVVVMLCVVAPSRYKIDGPAKELLVALVVAHNLTDGSSLPVASKLAGWRPNERQSRQYSMRASGACASVWPARQRNDN